MRSENPQPSKVKLAICITTYNRSTFIGATLESILLQLTTDCEVVVLDGASTDNTEEIVTSYARRCDRLRYVRNDRNNGWDSDCNRVVELAHGEFCWLMTDDDLLKPRAIESVLQALRRDWSFIIVNAEARSFDMSKVVQDRCINVDSDRVYTSTDIDQLFADLGGMLTYVGGFIVKREIWIAREKERYFGSMFTHVGVIFQKHLPGDALVIAEPYISYRMGNAHTWSPRTFEVFLINWPSLVWSLELSDWAKRKVCAPEPWRDFQELLWCRGRGCYSLNEYRMLVRPRLPRIREKLIPLMVALLPGIPVNAFCILYFAVTSCERRGVWLQFMRESRYYFRNWRIFERNP